MSLINITLGGKVGPVLKVMSAFIISYTLHLTPDPQVLRESKALMRSTNRSALEQANERECEALKRVWGSSQGTDSILKYLQKKLDQL
jgi:hypothetical protein